MPNGYHGPADRWRELAAELAALDTELEAFASKYGMEIRRNERAWPNRKLRWRKDLERAIEIYLVDESLSTYAMGVSAYLDLAGRRYWRGANLREDATFQSLSSELRELLETAYRLASSWALSDLEDAGDIR